MTNKKFTQGELLEKLVPPLELCKLIPAGEFEDSVLVWGYSCDKRNTEPFVDERDCVEHCRRNMVNAPPAYPAPTLKELLRAISPGETGFFCSHEGDGSWNIGDCECDLYVKNGYEGENPEALALRWWFEQKGIDYE